MSKRISKVLAVSVPPETARDFEALAEQEGRNKSEMFREMLRIYQSFRETGRFETLQRYGAARARTLGVTTELGRVLTEKLGWESPYAEEVVSQLLRIAEVVDPTERLTDITDDPADNRVLEAAAAGDAETQR
jgi:hypothetical protein